MDRRRAGNPGRQGYVVDTPLPRGRVINELDGVAPALAEGGRRTGTRNLKMENFDEGPRYQPEQDNPALWPAAPNRRQVRNLKKGGVVKKPAKAKNWEGTKADLAEDKKLAKARGMSLKTWESSAADKKHDKQKSAKGLAKKPRR